MICVAEKNRQKSITSKFFFLLFGAVRVKFSCFFVVVQDRYAAGGFDSLGHLGTSFRERRGVRDIQGKALRVIPRGKQRLTVYRALQVSESVNSFDF